MRFASLLLPLAALAAAPATAADPAPEPPALRAVAPAAVLVVDGKPVTPAQFEQALASAVRVRYYHRTPPDAEMASLRREVADALIEILVASQAARERGLSADAAQLERDLGKIEARFRDRPGWAEHRAVQVAAWRADLEDRYLAEALEKQVRADASPTPTQVREFYDANPALFTEPEKVRMGLILLKTDPSAGRVARERAREEAARIRKRLAQGADFAALAKLHSGDDSAAKGGDLGYVHRGALPEAVQAAADALDAGRISEPLDILEGIAIIRVADRKPAQRRAFEDVAERARELQRRRMADETWKTLASGLRARAKITIDTARYPELAAAPDAARAAAASASR